MLSRRKPLAALAAVTAALVIAVPATSASAATTTATVDPTVCQLLNLTSGPFGPTRFIIGGASLGAVLAHAGATVGCPAPAPNPSPLLPIAPWW
jgi:type IV secretory pathway VirB2 component (pilin)